MVKRPNTMGLDPISPEGASRRFESGSAYFEWIAKWSKAGGSNPPGIGPSQVRILLRSLYPQDLCGNDPLDTGMNEYEKKFFDLRKRHRYKTEQWFGKRQELVEKYSWAVPSNEVLSYIEKFDSIVDMGAGSGYWAHLLEERGVDVRAYDIDPPDETWTEVEGCCDSPPAGWNEEAYKDVQENPTMLVWPPLNGPVGIRACHAESPHILYIGESRGGCTASDEFFDRLDKRYGLVRTIDLPSYAGVNDNFYHYVRKT